MTKLRGAILLLVACGLVGALAAGSVPMVAITAGSVAFGASMLLFEAVSNITFPRRLIVGVVGFALSALLLGEHLQFYETFVWWDLALHAVSAWILSIVGMGLALLPTAGGPARSPVWILATLAFSFSMTVGAIWEVMEFGLDQTIGTNTQTTGLVDTMWDIVANLAGAVLGAVVGHVAAATGRRVPSGGGLLLDFVVANRVLYGAWVGPLARPERQVGGAQAGSDGTFKGRGQAGRDVVAGE
ncbi:hypothetical protein JSE7799_03184 [Jannaschia seosinensis]|uniref:DUF2238 domain-containing protein n=1 Tax=Jannaschia seosinensis TaxID=313367 RepID=A0A0M7BF89_9RHOB|nr:hypothetical protein [Jannaschia seosinensis]CUH40452.1 hypothetical protein JSE7799_03184 [Jannaschia seosinensis]